MFPTLLTRIRQTARNGDTSKAWHMFEEAGLCEDSSSEVLALKGRLLKDRSLRCRGRARLALARQAAAAYRASAGERRATYPLINAATTAFLCGDVIEAREDARRILAIIESGDYEPETGFWLNATVAEARLLLGDKHGSREALLAALASAPQAWEDRAATIRQFREILQATGDSFEMLDGLSPPATLHFSGIMNLTGHEDEVCAQIGKALHEIGPGAAYGALAAGADIFIAEMALELGIQLHVVLPGSLEQFRATSVARFGRSWLPRFEALVDRADSLIDLPEQGEVTHSGIIQATAIAMGLAIRRANQLATDAVALHVGRSEDELALALSWWKESGRTIYQVRRDVPRGVPFETVGVGASRAILACDQSFPDRPGRCGDTWQTEEGYWLRAFDDVLEAVRYGREILSCQTGARLGLDYGTMGSEISLEVAGQRAIYFARAAQGNDICGAWPHVCVFDVLDPEVRFEPSGELVTPFGDIPIARYSPLQPE
ncbi:TRAFs-binding domain-containing protein [Novosphingobium profundi]|uniref:TRAFs-binding domain-containing protein n=1 Tax=Novosphingobium profundi TaxID=1774954 RepID=UPI001CFF3B9B|nr:TRAFs-binding domain-containing protein [Novosphingobium profundi]